MAVFGPYHNAYLAVSGVDLSDHVKSLELKVGADALDVTCMGNHTKINVSGLKNWTITARMLQDFASSKVHATLYGLLGGAAVSVVMRPDTASAGAGNPQWSGQAIVTDYSPATGSVGAILETPVTFAAASELTETSS